MNVIFWGITAFAVYCLIGRMLESAGVSEEKSFLWPLYAAGAVLALGLLPIWFLPACGFWIYWRNKTLASRQEQLWQEERPRRAAHNRRLAEESRARAKRFVNANHLSSAVSEEYAAELYDALARVWEADNTTPEVNRVLYDVPELAVDTAKA